MTAPIRMARRHCLLWASACLSLTGWTATVSRLPIATDLARELTLALAARRPLLVMVSLEGCPFCKVVRENYLGPMREREGLAVVQIDLRNKAPVRDFQGKSWTQDALIASWGAKVAPTVLFFGQGGVEVAQRLEGGYLPDFYGAYLDDRLRAANAAVKA